MTLGSETFPSLFNCILDDRIARLENVSIERHILITYHVTTYHMGATHPGMPTLHHLGMAVYLDSRMSCMISLQGFWLRNIGATNGWKIEPEVGLKPFPNRISPPTPWPHRAAYALSRPLRGSLQGSWYVCR